MEGKTRVWNANTKEISDIQYKRDRCTSFYDFIACSYDFYASLHLFQNVVSHLRLHNFCSKIYEVSLQKLKSPRWHF
jgi:hypothetical protein